MRYLYNDSMKRGVVWAVLLSLLGIGGAFTAKAATFNSTNFSINGNIGDSAAGAQASTNYALTSAAGESIAGQGTSKSYKLGQGYVPTLDNSLQVVVQPNGLAAYWPLDDVSSDGGPMLDESQNQNNGTYSTSAVSVAGKVGTAWSDFNGNQFMTAPDGPSYPTGTAMSVSAWIKPSSLTNQQGIITKWDYAVSGGTVGEWALQTTTPDEIRMFVSSGSGDPGNNYVDTTNADIPTNAWTHVIAVYDGSQTASNRVRIFINGVQATTSVGGTIPPTLYDAGTNPVAIGDFLGLSRRFSGAIDEAKIFGRALTATEVKAEYEANNIGVPAGLAFTNVTPGISQTSAFDSIVQTSAGGYTLAINQNNNLTNGGSTIPSVAGSIASPVAWSEGTTKGLGFTLYSTNATALPGTWSSGSAYAALPASGTSFYTRTNYTGGVKDVVNMRLRLDTPASQPAGTYSNQVTVTGTMIP